MSDFGDLDPFASQHDERLGAAETGLVSLSKQVLVRLVSLMSSEFAASLTRSLLEPDDDQASALVIALFENAESFAPAARRYEAYVAAGATVVVGTPAGVDTHSPGVVGIDTRGMSSVEGAWAFLVLHPHFASALVAVAADEDRDLSPVRRDARYACKWTARRDVAIEAARQILATIRPKLPIAVYETAESALRALLTEEPSEVESRLASMLESMLASLSSDDGAPVGHD